MHRTLHLQVWILSGIILANFIAQVLYFLHLYYPPQHLWRALTSSLPVGSVLVLFLAGDVLLIRRTQIGYALMAVFLSLEFLFYLWNIAGGVIHGFGWFFHLNNPDPVLWTVFAIGYVNFLAAGYFLFLLVSRRRDLLAASAEIGRLR